MKNNNIENVLEYVQESESVTKVYIMENTYISRDIIEEMTDCKFAIFGNRHCNDIISEFPELEAAKGIIADIECYYDMQNEDDVKELAESYNIGVEIVQEVAAIIDKTNNTDTPEFICEVMNTMYPELDAEYTIIRGYCQGDCNEMIYANMTESEVNEVKAIYFGMYKEVKIVNGDDEYWTYLNDDDIWDCENGRNGMTFQKLLGIPEDSEIYLEGHETVSTFTRLEA